MGSDEAPESGRNDTAHPGDRTDCACDGHDRVKALEAGCDDYDTKPVEFHRLVSKIQSVLARETQR